MDTEANKLSSRFRGDDVRMFATDDYINAVLDNLRNMKLHIKLTTLEIYQMELLLREIQIEAKKAKGL